MNQWKTMSKVKIKIKTDCTYCLPMLGENVSNFNCVETAPYILSLY